MTNFRIKPSLDSLPPELIDIILSYLFVPVHVAELRALSHVCRRLREHTLPLVWARVQVSTVRELGLLHELLRLAPRIALLIRSFRLLWDMDGDCGDSKLVVYRQGSTLELAFRDRLALWNEAMQGPQAEARKNYLRIFYDNEVCLPPGENPDWEEVWRLGPAAYNWQAAKRGRGPDGNGEDQLIKNADQFVQCITEITCMLTKIETFGWETPVTPMPRGVFDALARLETLKDLSVIFSEHMTNLSDVPLWEIAGQLSALTLLFDDVSRYEDRDIMETSESSLTAIEERKSRLVWGLRDSHDNSRQAEYRYHLSVACHIIVAAARGGHLKKLRIGSDVQQVFAVCALLPCWLRIEECHSDVWLYQSWQKAAELLRPFFVHASRRRDWLRVPLGEAKALDRRLTHQDIAALHLYFESGGQLETWGPEIEPGEWQSHRPVFELYLPWLVQDDALRQEVLETWNGIVERGETEKLKCPCHSCNLIYEETGLDSGNRAN